MRWMPSSTLVMSYSRLFCTWMQRTQVSSVKHVVGYLAEIKNFFNALKCVEDVTRQSSLHQIWQVQQLLGRFSFLYTTSASLSLSLFVILDMKLPARFQQQGWGPKHHQKTEQEGPQTSLLTGLGRCRTESSLAETWALLWRKGGTNREKKLQTISVVDLI